MPVEPIEDPSVRIQPGEELIDFVVKNVKSKDVPENVLKIRDSPASQRSQVFLSLDDIKWLDKFIKQFRSRSTEEKIYIHEFLVNSNIHLPTPKTTPRSPELEARIKKLTSQQNAREYQAMTKGVDPVRKRLPEDTLAYQMKQINRQLIAVSQFVFSVLAGFAFGFIGIELLVGHLDFGFRLLLGIICALTIALAEIYFLAKKLNEDHNEEMYTTKLHQE